jgi:predicted nucleotidyltransferase
MKEYNKRVLLVLLFGSSVYSPRRARDIDIIIVVDKLSSIEEKFALEQAVKRALRELDQRRVYDIIVFDEESFTENTAPGCLVSGVVAGYEVIFDELEFKEIVKKLALSILEEKPVIYKKNRKLNIALYFKHLLRKIKGKLL